jgi:hypothetical protein
MSTLISTCSVRRRAIAPIASSVRSRLVTERYLLASPSACVRAMTMLCARPIPASVNPARMTLGWAPEATMATMRLAAKATVVASHAHGVLGADIEKNTVIMSNTRTMLKRSRILDRSYSRARLGHSGCRPLSLTERTYSPSSRL